MYHMDLVKQTQDTLNREIFQSQKDIQRVTGVKTTLFRPPYGRINNKVKNTISNSNQQTILWSIDTEDWKNKSPKSILSIIQTYIQPGSIILMHDIHPSTAQSLPQILDSVIYQGYHPVTVTELMPYIKDTTYGG